MDKEKADEMKARSRAAFDVQAGTYDIGMQGTMRGRSTVSWRTKSPGRAKISPRLACST